MVLITKLLNWAHSYDSADLFFYSAYLSWNSACSRRESPWCLWQKLSVGLFVLEATLQLWETQSRGWSHPKSKLLLDRSLRWTISSGRRLCGTGYLGLQRCPIHPHHFCLSAFSETETLRLSAQAVAPNLWFLLFELSSVFSLKLWCQSRLTWNWF